MIIERLTKLDSGIHIYTKINEGNTSLPTIVFCHGDGKNSTEGEVITEYFSKKGHTTFNFDRAGHGLSENIPKNCWTMNYLTKILREVLEKNNIKEPLVMIGDSSGGMLDLQYIVNNPSAIKGLVLINTTPSYPGNYMPYKKEELESLLSKFEENATKLFEKQVKFDFSKSKNLSDEEISLISLRYTDPLAYMGG